MARSLTTAVRWSLDYIARKSWLRRALLALAVLVTLNILINSWQSWHDFRAADTLAAQRLNGQASLITARIEDRLQRVSVSTAQIENMLDSQTLADAELTQLAMDMRPALGEVLIAVFAPDGRLLAGSSAGVGNQVPGLESALARVRNDPSDLVTDLATWAQEAVVIFAKGHRNRGGELDAVIVQVVNVEQRPLEAMNLPAGTSVLLRDSADRVIARYPAAFAMPPGQKLIDGTATTGPTTTTRYLLFPLDGTQQLVATRRIPLGSTASYWTLDVGLSVDVYRASVRQSLYLNLAGAATVLVMLASAILLVRRERHLFDQVQQFASLISTIVKNMPTPVVVVQPGEGKVLVANESMLAVFGAVAGAGQPFARLFVEPTAWTDTQSVRQDETIAMLTRDGPRHMLLYSTRLPLGVQAEASDALLVTLVDVSDQHQQLTQLRTEADIDALTGLPNRRSFARAAAQAVAHARGQHRPLSLLALDLDYFKLVNDTYGHAAGDRVLAVVACVLEGALRAEDLAARLGGEEFAAILPDTTVEQAQTVAERIRTSIQNTPIALEAGQTISQTVSIGIASYHDGEDDIAAAHERADAALYAAKSAGRNRVHIAIPAAPESTETTLSAPSGRESQASATDRESK
ncbi:sensor domain-containing diguanylate cyclase [Paraburkholderia nodosa]|uniref:sensor domain-containing diguanylate cyclase n=1 Tax=Paraburkholderia nodosa TaxID=392320 RepID=UPI0004B9F3DA|nr:GGDEF domain-containing protein [Paraburkholderia nodosa]